MTLYEQMTNAIESFTKSCLEAEQAYGRELEGVRGMIDGATYARDLLTIEACECVVY
jgi:hypothetical protein